MIYPDLPRKALSIMQPWAWLIVNGHKDIENRDWPTQYRGLVAIHAGKKLDETPAISLDRAYHPVSGRRVRFAPEGFSYPRGGIVGVAEIIGCVDATDSEWFVGGRRTDGTCGYGFIIRNARPVELIPVRGHLGFFDWRKNIDQVAA
ncbi:ASCH domain-containing protein [Sinorhizobium chiapasense]|uniref:ASCH domain-containing protein n=1 Tax=Sinorhizobium chiapasense TaxID=501572 RepID=A0ABZ2BAX0_9HYPH